MSRFRPVVAALALALPAALVAQAPAPRPPDAAATSRHPEEGRPLVRRYQPFEAGGGGQVWSIVQDRRGVLYFGTNAAALEFDGARWRRIETGDAGSVRAMALAEDGRIYLGTARDLGYLEPDAEGQMRFVSLADRLPADAPPFNDVWRVFVTPDGVLFQTERAIFRWTDGAFTMIRPVSSFFRSSYLDGRLYVGQPESGLHVLERDTLRLLPGTEPLATEPFPVVLEYDAERLLIGTRTSGLFLYDGQTLTPFATEVDDDFLKAGQLYRGFALSDGTYALTNTSRGLAIIDRRGRRVTRVDRRNGLPSDVVYYVMRDREGALWAALDRGMARIEVPSPLTFFTEEDGLTGALTHAVRSNGQFYVALQNGVRRLQPRGPSGGLPRFEPVPPLESQCWWFSEMSDSERAQRPFLVVACTMGLYEVDGAAARPIKLAPDLSFRPNSLHRSTADPTRLWIGLFDGIASMRYRDGRWIDEGRLPDVHEQVRSLFEDASGTLWAGTPGAGLLRLTLASAPSRSGPRPAVHVERFGPPLLPSGMVYVDGAKGEPYFSVGLDDPRIFRYDRTSQRFTADPAFDGVGVDPIAARGAFGAIWGPDGSVYLNKGRETAVLRPRGDGTWDVDRTTFARFGASRPPSLLHPERDGIIWISLQDGRLVRFDSNAPTFVPPSPAPLVRRVSIGTGQVLFHGAGTVAERPNLPAGHNTLRFDFAAPSFVEDLATEFQSRLDGFDEDWSPWSTDVRRDYTNLGYGDYRFRVRARGFGGEGGEEAVYAFTILAPWYRTAWAYGAYLALAAIAFMAAARIQRRRVLAKERERARFDEAKVRAEAAEALARTEQEGKKNVELLGEIGREITASLEFETIFGRLYERINQLADADVFGVGLYHPERREIEYRLAIEKGKRYAPYSRDTSDPNQLPVWCIEHRQPVFINDLRSEHAKYISTYDEQSRQLEDGSMSQQPQSLIYMPLLAKDRVLGIITIQSFERNAYTEHHLNVMQGLAAYTAIALDNANAYRQLNEHEHEIRRLFEEAERARARAEEADAAKSAFLSTVSHELRTPLTSVLGFAKIIKRRLEERIFPLIHTDDRKVRQTMQQVEENLKVVVSEGERLTKLIDDVLDLAKIQAGKLEWHMETVSIAEVVEHATAATSSLFEQKGLALAKEVPADLPAVTGDRDRLIQVVINLISNAVKFTDQGTVTCRAERQNGEIVVSVVDTGLGIAPVDQPKVFERFKQVGDTLTDKPKGTGLGLPICKEIVEYHGGRIWVASAPGRGSTFSFSLPLPVTSAQAPAAAPIELAALIRQLRDQVAVTTPRPSDRQARILVVDDDPSIRELLSQEFTEAGYAVSVAADGREALKEVRRERPDLVVLDVMMPEMNGFDVAAVLKNDPLTMDVPIVILSIVQDRDRGYRLGVDRYLTKPIDTDLLFREVGSLIEQRKSHKRVLVVDEDASTLKTLTDVLTARGYSVQEARSEDLIERAVALQPDIIMLNSIYSARAGAVQMLRFEKGLENVLFLVYQ
jgi:signal transduction histidine kinase/DNA-binding response OmpR family regulator